MALANADPAALAQAIGNAGLAGRLVVQARRAVPETADSDADLLSEREKEVAELVLAGLTYKQVGKRLFISAKTVEHHIGRIKQRLGCANREELLSRLRELLGHH